MQSVNYIPFVQLLKTSHWLHAGGGGPGGGCVGRRTTSTSAVSSENKFSAGKHHKLSEINKRINETGQKNCQITALCIAYYDISRKLKKTTKAMATGTSLNQRFIK